MKHLHKLLKVIGDVVLILVVVLLVLATFVTVFARINGEVQPSFFGFQCGVVVTGSMEPEISVGSMVIAKSVSADTLQIGDDIMFISDDPTVPSGSPVTHRIEDISIDADGAYSFTTKGIVNDTADDYPVSEEQIIGKIIVVSEFGGMLLSWLRKPWIYPVLIGILFIDLIWNIVVVARLAEGQGESS